MKKYLMVLLLTIASVLAMAGCGSDEDYDYRVYYLDTEETKLVSVGHKLQSASTDMESVIDDLITGLETEPEEKNIKAPFAGKVKITDYAVNNNMLYVNFDGEYNKLDKYSEILSRAALVKTLIQVEGIDSVSFTVDNMPLMDQNGNAVGPMSSNSFAEDLAVSDKENEIRTVNLYFANEDGTRLVKEERELQIKGVLSVERQILEALVKGPASADLRAVINPDIKIISVNVKDGTCYVNLDNMFLENNYDVEPEIVIYAIVNSLTDINTITKVQISVNANSNVIYNGEISLNQAFIRNLDLVQGE